MKYILNRQKILLNVFIIFCIFTTNTDPRSPKIVSYYVVNNRPRYPPTNVSSPRVQCGYSRKVACGRSASIPPILEGDTDTWEEEDGAEAADKKQSRKRYRVL